MGKKKSYSVKRRKLTDNELLEASLRRMLGKQSQLDKWAKR